MARVWMLWHGGASYAAPDVSKREDCEAFDSLREALADFCARPGSRYYSAVERRPAGDGGPSAHIFFADPFGRRDPYPDRVLFFGPKGGLRMEPG
jgi:hypothetical protein